MSNFMLTTDTSCDVFRSELNEKNIPWVPLTFVIDSQTFEDNFSSDKEYQAFYKKIRSGAMPTTSQINIFTHEEFFEEQIKKGAGQIMHLCLSSGLSNTYNSAKIAAQNIIAKHEGVKIEVIDTLSATQGHHFVLRKAHELQQNGTNLTDAAKELNDFCKRVHHLIIVDDLMHLKRGGRVSGAAAYVGSVLKIKPLLIINHIGKLAIVKKIPGLNKALKEVVELAQEHISDAKNAKFHIAHADSPENAERLQEILKSTFPNCQITIGYIGPVIGSHTGAGTLGLVFEGTKRLENV